MTDITIEQIDKVLDVKVRPDLSLHGGDIKIEKIEDGVLHVRLLGQCSGCPSANLTMESLVNEELQTAFPQLKQVVLMTGVSEGLLSDAREVLRKRHQ